MKKRKLNNLMSIIVIGLFLVTMIPSVSAFWIPPDIDPPPPTTIDKPTISSVSFTGYDGTSGPGSASIKGKCYVSFDSDSDLNKVYLKKYVSGSWVKIRTWTGVSNGWFEHIDSGLSTGTYSYRFYAYSYDAGIPYYRATSTYYVSVTTSAKPPQPIISNLHSNWDGMDVTVSWNVNWGTVDPPISSKDIRLYIDDDADPSDVSPISWSDGASFSYTLTDCTDGEIWYKIWLCSYNSAGASPVTDTGVIHTATIYTPIDDTYACREQPSTIMDAQSTYELFTCDNGDVRIIYMKFQIDSPTEIARATLFLYQFHDYPGGGGEVGVYPVSSSWEEETLTYNNRPTSLGAFIESDTDNILDSYDSWDLTSVATTTTFSIALVELVASTGKGYWSREYTTHLRPRLLVEYKTGWEEIPTSCYGPPTNPAISDDFNMEDDVRNYWSFDLFGNPDWHPYWEDSCIKFGIGSNSQTTTGAGYTLRQYGLDYKGGFQFEADVELTVNSGTTTLDYPDSAMILLSAYSGSALVARVGIEYIEDSGIWGISKDGTSVYEKLQCPYSGTLRSLATTIRLVRNPATNQIAMSFDYLGWRTLEVATGSAIVDMIELTTMIVDQDEHSYSFTEAIDNFRNVPVMSIANPDGDEAPFIEPIREWDFDDATDIVANWKPSDDTSSFGGITEARSLIDGHSWYVPTSISRNSWAMEQIITNREGLFNFDAICNQQVSFSVQVGSSTTDSRVRAWMKYEASSIPHPILILGDWCILGSGDNRWQSVSVDTTYPLPVDLTSLEVGLDGNGLSNQLFSAYIDWAALAIAASSTDTGYFGDTEWGTITNGIALRIAGTTTIDTFTIDMFPSISAVAKSGYCIQKIEMDFDVDETLPRPNNYADIGPYGAMESNDRGYAYTDPADYEAEVATKAAWRNILTLGSWGISGGVGLYTALSGTSYGPVGLVFTLITTGLCATVLQPSRRNPIDATTMDGNPGNVDADYPVTSGSEITFATVGAHLHWTSLASGHLSTPTMRVSYTVYWNTVGGAQSGISHHYSTIFVNV